jgi:hypothetical protein
MSILIVSPVVIPNEAGNPTCRFCLAPLTVEMTGSISGHEDTCPVLAVQEALDQGDVEGARERLDVAVGEEGVRVQ